MTNKEFLTAVSKNNITAEVIDYATEALRKVNESASNRAAAKSAEDAPLLESLRNLLTNTDHPMTAAEIGVALGVHTSKATALCKRLEGVHVTDVQVDRRIVKGYSL
jgi:hypothetical protein